MIYSIVVSILANIFILGLFLYNKLLPYKDRLKEPYNKIFAFFDSCFSPVFNFLRTFVKPVAVGQGISVDMAQIIVLAFLLILSHSR